MVVSLGGHLVHAFWVGRRQQAAASGQYNVWVTRLLRAGYYFPKDLEDSEPDLANTFLQSSGV